MREIRYVTRVLVALGAFALMLLPSAALAQQSGQGYGQQQESVESNRDQVQSGENVTIQVMGYAANAQVTVTVTGVMNTTFTRTTTAAGNLSFVLEVPCGTQSGDAPVNVSGPDGEGNTVTNDTTFAVAGSSNACAAPGLSATGQNLSNGGLLAIGAIVLGGGLVAYTRRRRSHTG